MWIKRTDFEKLITRVEELEKKKDLVKTVDSVDRYCGWTGLQWKEPRMISASEAVALLAKHLGVQFRWNESKSAHGSLEKVPRK